MSTNRQKKSKQRNIVVTVCSVRIQYLYPVNIVVEVYCKGVKGGAIEDLSVIRKDNKRVNRFHKWCIVLCHGNFKSTKLYAVKR